MKAFLSSLFYISVFKSNHENTKRIFTTDASGRESFRCFLNFLTLLNYIRFDDSTTRSQRLETDPLAAISEMFQLFIANCKKAYGPGAYLCLDEMLVPFRGRCKFIVYMPKKPAKYGLKILVVCDAETFYVYNAYIYHGKDSDGLGLAETERKLAIPTQVLDLSGVNAYVLYKTCTAVRDIPRVQFLQNLAYSLVLLPLLKRRVYNNRLPRELRLAIARVLGPNKPPEPVTEPSESTEAATKTCKICPSRLKRRTKYNCIKCRKSICLGCSKTICVDCVNDK
ncbi:PiggyBac transposable element-derived protein 4 [Eumeta japonica]|uniref:PiggyBac transposable element-derived protein 4 n=1 Tax=Eumeta variegata TaxID=151549 RepID=A0A4C1V872_EUMVA|nr:PiggyBac transposable element-derived protein 4 [Eumeta japonica]